MLHPRLRIAQAGVQLSVWSHPDSPCVQEWISVCLIVSNFSASFFPGEHCRSSSTVRATVLVATTDIISVIWQNSPFVSEGTPTRFLKICKRQIHLWRCVRHIMTQCATMWGSLPPLHVRHYFPVKKGAYQCKHYGLHMGLVQNPARALDLLILRGSSPKTSWQSGNVKPASPNDTCCR